MAHGQWLMAVKFNTKNAYGQWLSNVTLRMAHPPSAGTWTPGVQAPHPLMANG